MLIKQNYFEGLDTGWNKLIIDVYEDTFNFKPEYENVSGKICISTYGCF